LSASMRAVEPPDTRFTQANERTFLAWTRTGLAYIAGGLAIEQLLHAGRPARLAVSIPLILLGGFVGVFGYFRWQQAEEAIRSGKDLPPSWIPRLLAWVFALLTVGALVLVIASTR
jgi:putative membrane protein